MNLNGHETDGVPAPSDWAQLSTALWYARAGSWHYLCHGLTVGRDGANSSEVEIHTDSLERIPHVAAIAAERNALAAQLEQEAQCQSLLRDERDGYRAVAEQRAREVERLANEMRALLIPANDSTSLADTGTPPLQYSRLSGTDMARYVDLEYGYVCYANAKSRPVCFSLSAETK